MSRADWTYDMELVQDIEQFDDVQYTALETLWQYQRSNGQLCAASCMGMMATLGAVFIPESEK